MSLGFSIALNNDGLAVGTSVSLIGGGSPSFVGDELAMFTPWGFETTKITDITGTVTVRIDLPTLAVREAIAFWVNINQGSMAIRTIDSSGPTTIDTFSPQSARTPRLKEFFTRGLWQSLTATAIDRIEIDITPATTSGGVLGDPDPAEIFRFHIASDLRTVREVIRPIRNSLEGLISAQSGISQTRAHPHVGQATFPVNWSCISFADVATLLEVWRDSDYGACPVIYLEPSATGDGLSKAAECFRISRMSWRPVVQGADTWNASYTLKNIPHEQYPQGAEAYF